MRCTDVSTDQNESPFPPLQANQVRSPTATKQSTRLREQGSFLFRPSNLKQVESPLTSIPSMAASLLYSLPSSPNHGVIDTHRPP